MYMLLFGIALLAAGVMVYEGELTEQNVETETNQIEIDAQNQYANVKAWWDKEAGKQ